MKKIFLLFLLIFAVGCENPFDKYKESFDALGVAMSIGSEISEVTAIIDSLGADTDFSNLSEEDFQDLMSSLQTISDNLDNEQVQSIVEAYASEYEVDLASQADEIKVALNNFDAGGVVSEEEKAQMIALITNILDNLA